MFKPIGDLIFIEIVKQYEGIIMPDGTKPGSGDIFKVLAVGRGTVIENGVIVKPEVEVGDVVYIAGKIVNLPIDDGKMLCARASDVLAYDRKEVE